MRIRFFLSILGVLFFLVIANVRSVEADFTTDGSCPNSAFAANNVQISEIFISLSDNNWVELYNCGERDATLKGWYLQNSLDNTFAFPNTSILAGQYKVIDVDQDFFRAKGDEVKLLNSNKEVINQIPGYFSAMTEDRSWSSLDGNWCLAPLSQGEENTSCSLPSGVKNTPKSAAIPAQQATPAPIAQAATPTPIPRRTRKTVTTPQPLVAGTQDNRLVAERSVNPKLGLGLILGGALIVLGGVGSFLVPLLLKPKYSYPDEVLKQAQTPPPVQGQSQSSSPYSNYNQPVSSVTSLPDPQNLPPRPQA